MRFLGDATFAGGLLEGGGIWGFNGRKEENGLSRERRYVTDIEEGELQTRVITGKISFNPRDCIYIRLSLYDSQTVKKARI